MTDTAQSLPIQIRHRWEDRTLYTSTTAKTLAAAVLEAVAAKTDLSFAKLPDLVMPWGASLVGARLDGARLDGARLDGARLDGASLVGARLDGASLDGASLDGASLVGASLDGASLVGARLVGASLVGASLDGARLDGNDLAYAGPVGSARRIVYCFRAKADETHKAPWLVFTCGCFTGDEKAYRVRIGERYGAKDAQVKRWHAECLVALNACKAMAATWPKPAKVAKPKKAKA